MSWYDSNYRFRAAIAVDNTASAGTTQDVQITLPAEWAEFWNGVLSSGNDIRVTRADGVTLQAFRRATWTYASRVAVLEVDNLEVTANRMCLIWLYWGYASAADGASVFVGASMIMGYAVPEAPGDLYVQALPERPGATRPRAQLAKMANEEKEIYWDFRAALGRRASAWQRSLTYDEISRVSLCDVQLATVSQAGMIDVTKTRFLDGIVSTRLRAGTSGTSYTAICRVVTSLGRTLEARAIAKIKDVSEV